MKAFVFERRHPTTSSPYENCPNRNPAQVKFSSACDFRRFILATCTSCAAASGRQADAASQSGMSVSVSSRRLDRALQVPHLHTASFF